MLIVSTSVDKRHKRYDYMAKLYFNYVKFLILIYLFIVTFQYVYLGIKNMKTCIIKRSFRENTDKLVTFQSVVLDKIN